MSSTGAADQGEVTRLLQVWGKGDSSALEKLIPIVYGELRRLAAHYMGQENAGHTLQTTALVHEAYLKLTGRVGVDWQDRAHFFGVAAEIMRHLLVDHARARLAEKRGGAVVHVELDQAPPLAGPEPEEMLALDEALSRLAAMDARAARVVELRYFVGLEVEEAAAVLSVSEKTVKRDWAMARAWLSGELRK